MPTTLNRILLTIIGLLFCRLIAMAEEMPQDTRTIKRLTAEQARKLVLESKADELKLDGLTALDADTAKALAEFEGKAIFLGRLPTLDADSAQALAGFKGKFLHLDGLAKLDADTARAVAEFKGGRLSLNGLHTLDADTATALAEYVGRLSLGSSMVTQFIAKHPLSKDTAAAHVALLNGRLSHVIALDSTDAVTVAQALAARKGPLALPNLKKISPKTLSALVEKQGVDIPLIEKLELITEPDGSPAARPAGTPGPDQSQSPRGRSA
jgi:hypothetical protein